MVVFLESSISVSVYGFSRYPEPLSNPPTRPIDLPDGHHAIEPRVARPIDFAHPAGAQQGHNFTRPEASACRQRHDLESRDDKRFVRDPRDSTRPHATHLTHPPYPTRATHLTHPTYPTHPPHPTHLTYPPQPAYLAL
jgi:hypothetical protein